MKQHQRTRPGSRLPTRRRLMPRQAPRVPHRDDHRPAPPPQPRPPHGTTARRPAPAPHGSRLTGRGVGLLTVLAMAVAGAADTWLFPGGPGDLYGVLFLVVCCLSPFLVTVRDLAVAPLVAPTAFAVGLVCTGGLVDVVTALALRAEWLYGGTLLAVLLTVLRRTATARKLRLRS